jgi:hypothetical protein
MSLTERLAALFKAHPGEWMGARQLEIAGRQAWRTRVSDLRKPPYNMGIDNRVRRVTSGDPAFGGAKVWNVSEYRYLPAPDARPTQGHDTNTWTLTP